MPPNRLLAFATLLLALLAAGWQRARAVERLPPDFDELVYLPVAYRYAERMSGGRWEELVAYRENFEHPPLVKLLYASELLVTGTPEPDWGSVRVGRPLSAVAARPFRLTRGLSAGAGLLQVGLVGLVHPLAALLLALDSYHVKYTSQAYLEAVPGLFAVLAVLAFERARKRPDRLLPLALSGALLPFLVAHARGSLRGWAAFVLPALGLFLLAHPALWPHPVGNLWESLTFHWRYSQSPHVVRSALPWYQPLFHLTHATPTQWHPGVFATGATVWVLPPLALLGWPATLRRRPVWAVWALVAVGFLLVWPTKWAQYLLLALPPLAVCAGMGASALGESLRNALRRRAALRFPPLKG